ncbi:APC family permease [Sphingomonas sp. TDK1]|uniref:APC family permease n=1 Tax=Sphingomonas sp. TDK1 TaxID=453247 RepID=UPI0007D93200|nr:APC family permease [Sphingomonas sp. TDK1]OAN58127.1 amino acid transporter [Sphingomonas sp. TDK1]
MTDPKTQLDRSLGTAGVLFLTLSITTPASSLFVIVPGMLQIAGTGALIALGIAGLVCLCTALIYAELSSAFPVAGGEYVMVGQTLGPGAGFVMLGVNACNNLLFPPVAALGIASVASTVLPGLPAVPLAIAVLIASTLLGVLNVRFNAVLTGSFLAAEVAAVLVILALGLHAPLRDLATLLLHPVAPVGTALVPATAANIGLATSIAVFALNGYGAAVYFGEEMHAAPQRIAQSILLALLGALLLEVVPILAALIAAPDLAGFLTAEDPFGGFVRALGGAVPSLWVTIGIAIAIVNAVIACILANGRFFFATARDDSWGRPLDAWLAAIHPRFGSPARATLASGAIGIAACFLPLRLLLVLSGTGLIAIYAGLAFAAIAGRRRATTAHAPYRMPLHPIAAVVTLLVLAAIAWLNWLDPEEGRPALLATAAQILASLLYYALVLRRRGWVARLSARP